MLYQNTKPVKITSLLNTIDKVPSQSPAEFGASHFKWLQNLNNLVHYDTKRRKRFFFPDKLVK